jgi:peroxisomal 3,2-trans-enoyl-CoA isomerase
MNDLDLIEQQAKLLSSLIKNGVLTLTMTRPEKLNAWTLNMIAALDTSFAKASQMDEVKAVILTATGKYYSAGADLSGSMKLMLPKQLHQGITDANQALFDMFLNCTKPILVAVNGIAFGATVTSATLCNSIIASDNAVFSTPFTALGVTPEGCSSVLFARLMGAKNAQRMLGVEGWRPTADEALAAGLINTVVSSDNLMQEANRIAGEWVQSNEPRKYRGDSNLEELKAINRQESLNLADAFLDSKFLKGQAKFCWKKNKRGLSLMFYGLWFLRPIWKLLL